MIFACLFLAWLILPTKPEPVSIQPMERLVDQVAAVKDCLTVQAGETARRSKSGEWEVVKESLTSDHFVEAAKMVEAKKEIVIFTRAKCPPCDRWKKIEQPKFERYGWKVAYCDQHNYGLTPTFIIETGGKQVEHRGYLSFDKIDEVIK